MTVIRCSPRTGVRLEYRPGASLPWCVVDHRRGAVLAAFPDKRSALPEFTAACRALLRNQQPLPLYQQATP